MLFLYLNRRKIAILSPKSNHFFFGQEATDNQSTSKIIMQTMRQYEEILEKDGIYAALVYIITHIL